ncbi:hypothetical protein BT67DRAFT_56829 [Trichocladium antarcticum]|uniref:Uncharacterized protein n=1 Tax=Trichocladium antarcticum TaxID=1450529 RepID=A0AAN6UHW4_9PEZI|nr:hypothetical protein BT67DRAFT_56829 [Trichocladium antarcticum]
MACGWGICSSLCRLNALCCLPAANPDGRPWRGYKNPSSPINLPRDARQHHHSICPAASRKPQAASRAPDFFPKEHTRPRPSKLSDLLYSGVQRAAAASAGHRGLSQTLPRQVCRVSPLHPPPLASSSPTPPPCSRRAGRTRRHAVQSGSEWAPTDTESCPRGRLDLARISTIIPSPPLSPIFHHGPHDHS